MPQAAALFAALVDYGNAAISDAKPSQYVAGETDLALGAYAASLPTSGKKIEGAEEGAAFEFTNMTLLMGDTVGIRLRTNKTDLATVAGATALYDDEPLATSDYRVTTDANGNVCFDFFVNAKNFETILDLAIEDASGKQCLKLNTSAALVAADLVAVDMAGDGDIDSHKLLATVMLMMAVRGFVA